MTRPGWVTRADNYLNRITKAQIIEAVREAKGDKTAELLADLKKKEMARRSRAAACRHRLAARAAAHTGCSR